MNFRSKRVSFLGDSITAEKYTAIRANKMHTMDITYCDVIGEEMGITAENYGVLGTCISPNNIFPNYAFLQLIFKYGNLKDLR